MPSYEWCPNKDGTFHKCTQREINERLEEASRLGLKVACGLLIVGAIIIALVFFYH